MGQARFTFKKRLGENKTRGKKAYHTGSDSSFKETVRAWVETLIDLHTK